MGDTVLQTDVLAQASNDEKPVNPAREMAKARAAKLTPERRKEIARQAANTRWAKKKRKKH